MSDPLPQADARRKELIAGTDASGRLDAWLAHALEGDISRNRIKDLILAGAVAVNGTPVREPRRKVVPGDRVDVQIPEPADATPRPQAIALDILYEDDDLVVLCKPAGLVVHPGAGNMSGTLVNALLHHCGPSLSGIGGVRRPGIVHRLDKETSGVMVVAKNDRAHRHLAAQFADHGRSGALQRAYLACVWGQPEPLKGIIDAPLGRAASDRTKRSVTRPGAPDARRAVTHYRVRTRYGTTRGRNPVAALVECRLETGRTHQIRVHMAHIGHPLIGDPDYGAGFRTKANALPVETKAALTGFRRQALHAFLLEFEHPRTGRPLRFEAPPPDDMAALLAALEALPDGPISC